MQTEFFVINGVTVPRLLSPEIRNANEAQLRTNLARFIEIAEEEIAELNRIRTWDIKLRESIVVTMVGDAYDKDDFLRHMEKSREFNYRNPKYTATETTSFPPQNEGKQ